MAKIDVTDIKRKIIEFISNNGPSLPNPVAKHLVMQPMFAAAIMSELLNEKKIKTSSLKIGSSPLYYLPGQEARLEAFSDNLSGVEKEAYIKLKDNKFLEDLSQEPKIRVALRSIKDFAIPIQTNGKLYWKYFTISSDKLKNSLEDEGQVAVGERVMGQKILADIKENIISKEEQYQEILENKTKQHTQEIPLKQAEQMEPHHKTVEILSKQAEQTFVKQEIKHEKHEEFKPVKMKKLTEKDLFLENTKRMLHSKNIEVLEVIQYDKKQVIAKARVQVDKNCILFFIDKKRPDEKDLQKAYKKASEYKLPYYIVTQSEPPKKLKETSEIYKSLLGFGSIN